MAKCETPRLRLRCIILVCTTNVSGYVSYIYNFSQWGTNAAIPLDETATDVTLCAYHIPVHIYQVPYFSLAQPKQEKKPLVRMQMYEHLMLGPVIKRDCAAKFSTACYWVPTPK